LSKHCSIIEAKTECFLEYLGENGAKINLVTKCHKIRRKNRSIKKVDHNISVIDEMKSNSAKREVAPFLRKFWAITQNCHTQYNM
jgi:hypothetical protein